MHLGESCKCGNASYKIVMHLIAYLRDCMVFLQKLAIGVYYATKHTKLARSIATQRSRLGVCSKE